MRHICPKLRGSGLREHIQITLLILKEKCTKLLANGNYQIKLTDQIDFTDTLKWCGLHGLKQIMRSKETLES